MVIKCKIKKGDRVEVIAGDHRRSVGNVLRVLPKKEQLVVSGVALVKVKNRNAGSDPSFSYVERAIHCSNVRKLSEDA